MGSRHLVGLPTDARLAGAWLQPKVIRTRINPAVVAHFPSVWSVLEALVENDGRFLRRVLTARMAGWAHVVRLDANKPRHVDAQAGPCHPKTPSELLTSLKPFRIPIRPVS